MKSNRTVNSFLVLTILIVVYLLASGDRLLLIPLVEDPYLPLGNIITPIGFIAFNGLAFRLNQKKTLKWMAAVGVLLSTFWFGVSWLLAGNPATSFSNQPTEFRIWLLYTVLCVLLGLISLVGYLYLKLRKI